MAQNDRAIPAVLTPISAIDAKRVACGIKARLLRKGDAGRISRMNLSDAEKAIACGVSGRLLRGRYKAHTTHEIKWEE